MTLRSTTGSWGKKTYINRSLLQTNPYGLINSRLVAASRIKIVSRLPQVDLGWFSLAWSSIEIASVGLTPLFERRGVPTFLIRPTAGLSCAANLERTNTLRFFGRWRLFPAFPVTHVKVDSHP